VWLVIDCSTFFGAIFTKSIGIIHNIHTMNIGVRFFLLSRFRPMEVEQRRPFVIPCH
jgi:hypothetical protein